MKTSRVIALFILAICLADSALAQQVAPAITAPAGTTHAVPQSDGSVIFFKSAVEAWTPIIIAGVGALIASLFGVLKYRADEALKTWKASDEQRALVKDMLDKMQRVTEREANIVIAAAPPGIMDAQVTVSSKGIAEAANNLIAHAGDAMTALNITPERAAEFVVAAIGGKQALAATTSPAIVQTGDKPTAVNIADQSGKPGAPIQLPGATK